MAKIFDTKGNVISTITDKSSLTQKLDTLSDMYKNIYKFIPNPNRLIKQHGLALFAETFADSTVRSVVNTIVEGILSYEWDIVMDGDSEEELNLVYDTVYNFYNKDVLKKIIYAAFYGSQYLNIVWKYENNFIIIDDIIELPHDNVLYDNLHNLMVLTKESPLNGVKVLPMQVLPVVYDATYENPYGVGLFLNCFKYVFIKNNVLDFWTIFSEEFGSPGIKGSYSLAAAQSFKMDVSKFIDYFYDKLLDMRQSKIITHPEGTTVDMFPAGNSQSADIYKGLIDLCNTEITKLILGHSAGSESSPGKLGNEQMAMSNKFDRIEAYKNFVVSYINILLKWQHDLNFNSNNYYKVRLYQKDDINVYKNKAEVALQLQELGVKFTQQYFIDEFNINENYFTFDNSQMQSKNNPKAFNKNIFMNLLNKNSDNEDKKFVESLLETESFSDDILKSKYFKGIIDAQYSDIADSLKQFDNYDDMIKNIYNAFDDISIENLSKIIEKYNLIARIVGFNAGVEDASNQ